jgi:hypothetical protein
MSDEQGRTSSAFEWVMAYLFWLFVGACLWLSGFMTAVWLFVDRHK